MLHLIDRTRIETDWTCERRRYWANEHVTRAGVPKGVTPVEDALELKFGSALHSALSSLALGALALEDIASIIRTDITAAYSKQHPDRQAEALNLAEGLFWGFQRVLWPAWRDEYEILLVERELTVPIDKAESMAVMVKPDLVVRRKSDNTVWYLEYKTTGFKTQNWLEGWRYAIQLHIGCLAVERELGVPVEGAHVVGLYKGYEKDGKLRSPFTYAYYLDGVPGVVPDRWTHEWIRGWDLVPTTHYPGGMQAWANALPEDTLTEQFPVTGPISLRRDVMEKFLLQQQAREEEVLQFHRHAKGLPTALDFFFPQRFKNCRPLIGRPCPFIECCFSQSVASDPTGSGLYQPREPHHTLEIMEVEG